MLTKGANLIRNASIAWFTARWQELGQTHYAAVFHLVRVSLEERKQKADQEETSWDLKQP